MIEVLQGFLMVALLAFAGGATYCYYKQSTDRRHAELWTKNFVFLFDRWLWTLGASLVLRIVTIILA